MSIMGVIRLAPGEVGYFDQLTNIHLTLAQPQKPVISGMNTNNLRHSVKSGRLLLVSGSLEPGAIVENPIPQSIPVSNVSVNTDEIIETTETKQEAIIEPVKDAKPEDNVEIITNIEPPAAAEVSATNAPVVTDAFEAAGQAEQVVEPTINAEPVEKAETANPVEPAKTDEVAEVTVSGRKGRRNKPK